jgi:hypothetical protein
MAPHDPILETVLAAAETILNYARWKFRATSDHVCGPRFIFVFRGSFRNFNPLGLE